MDAETFLITFLIFLTIAVLVAYVATRLRIPYTIAMVLVGLGASILHFGSDLHFAVELEPELILLIFLLGLLFEASYHIDLSLLRPNLRAILLLAIPGVLISTTVVGLILGVGLGLPLATALLFGAIISATDPVAVIALFKDLGVDRRLDIALTTILAYGTYLLAEDGLNGLLSPVIAVVVAGIVVGNYGSRGGHSAASTTMIVTFWEFAVFSINSAVFLLIGFEVDAGLLLANVGPVLLAIGAVLIARAIVVYGLRWVINRKPPTMPLSWSHVTFWGGMRGAVSVALVLSLPAALESREELVALVFGCVLFSVIVQGLTIRPLLSRLGLTRRSDKERESEEALARVAAAQASSDALDRMRAEHLLSRPMVDRLQKRFEDWIEARSLHLFRMVAEEPSLAEANMDLMLREIGDAQKEALLRLMRRGSISEEVFQSP